MYIIDFLCIKMFRRQVRSVRLGQAWVVQRYWFQPRKSSNVLYTVGIDFGGYGPGGASIWTYKIRCD